MYSEENQPMKEKKSRREILMRLLEQPLELVGVFKKQSETLSLFFS
jgi:hypothetical protein